MRSLIILLVLLSAPGLALAQAGRFLLAVGDVVVARGQAEIRAATGTLVQSGDTIHVGPASNAQIRLADESIVGLRPGTIFRLDEFAYSGQGDGNERSLFTLLKGGFRTVTGAIGRLHSREHYAVRTPRAARAKSLHRRNRALSSSPSRKVPAASRQSLQPRRRSRWDSPAPGHRRSAAQTALPPLSLIKC